MTESPRQENSQFRFRMVAAALMVMAFIALSGFDVESPRVQFVTTEPLGLIYFMNWVAKHAGSNALFSEFFKQHPLTSSETELLAEFQQAFEDRSKYPQYVELEGVAASSQNVAELVDHLPKALSKEDKNTVILCLRHFDPLYRKLVWRRLADQASSRVKDFETTCRGGLSDALLRVEHLCGSDWPNSRTFIVAIVMLPNENDDAWGRDAHTAGALGSICVVENMPQHGSQEYLGTIFHELCHQIWCARPRSTEQKLQAAFVAANGAKAYNYFPEAFATALGSGWYATAATGSPAKYWYSDKTIKQYAKALLPLFDEYLEHGRVIEDDFGRRAASLFQQY